MQEKLIIFGSEWDTYQYAHQEWINNPHIDYLVPFQSIGAMGLIQRLLFNPRWTHIIPIELKRRWNAQYVQSCSPNQPICFIILENWLRFESNTQLLPDLRKKFPNAHIICYLQDLFHTICDIYTHNPIDLEYLKTYCNAVITYDHHDAEIYNIDYFPTVFSAPKLIQASCPIYDLYFLGSDKGRLPELLQIAQEMEKHNKSIAFYIIGVPKSKQQSIKGVHYLSTQKSYQWNIRHVLQSKCILELLQSNASSETFRTWEAISFNKKLLTNNLSITQAPWYDNQYISVLHSVDSLDWQFINQPIMWPQNPYKKLISPNQLLEHIESLLHIRLNK